MRELRFRAWWKDTKRFLDGDEWYMTCSGAKHLHYSIYPYSDDDFVIEQYTGVKDNNGREIYEGDIVKARWYRAKNARLDTKGEIKFNDGWFYIKDDPDGQDRLGVPIHNCYDIKIVGNIHEREEQK